MQVLNSFFAIVLSLVCLAATAHGMTEKRTALIIGNSAYEHASPLVNPTNDARAMSVKLQQLGFEVIEGFDLTHAQTNAVVRDFSKSARDSDINLLFYAGHGISVDGVNYIIPVDARLEDETALAFEAIEVDFITRMMSYSDSANLVFLDACRDNPLTRSLSRSLGSSSRSVNISQGLAEMRTPSTGKGLAIAFSTSPGEIALDGEGVNSPFTASLLQHLDAPNTDIATILSRVVGDVWEATGESQRPWLSSSLTGTVILNQKTVLSAASVASEGAAAPQASSGMLEEQKMLFDLAKESGAAEDYLAYLDTFPNGLFANNARRAVQRLKSETATTQTASLSINAPSAQNSRSAAINENGALSLSVTTAVRNQPSTEYTEGLLGLDRQKRGEIQSRINAVLGPQLAVDGLWGPGTRKGISSWQAYNSLTTTGYFNEPQLELLVSQSEGRFTPFVAPVAKVRAKSSGSSGTKRAVRKTQQQKKPNLGELGQFLQGAGTLLNSIKR